MLKKRRAKQKKQPHKLANYPHLREYLKHVKSLKQEHHAVTNYIEHLSFQSFALILLDVRKAITQPVHHALKNIKPNTDIVFIIGPTRAGKSTTMYFLRGDEMILEDNNYHSKQAPDGVISHNAATSCTFTPNVISTNGLVLADFPGFCDTNGEIVDLGIDLAVKALIKKHPPKILLLDSIINTHGAYASAKKIKRRLDNLIDEDKRQHCLLGLTQYTIQHNFKDLQEIEKESHKPEENKSLEVKRDRIKNNIKEQEDSFLKTYDLKCLVRLDRLENEECFKEAHQALQKAKQVTANEKNSLAANFIKIMTELFQNNLNHAECKNQKNQFDSVDALKTYLKENSFIHAVLSTEISELLYLPEMDSDSLELKKLNENLITDAMQKHENAIIGLLAALKLRDKKTAAQELDKKVEELESYLKRRSGLSDASWSCHLSACKSAVTSADSAAELFNLPEWLSVLKYIPTQLPNHLFKLAKSAPNKSTENTNQENPSIYLEEVENLYRASRDLQAIKLEVCDKPLADYVSRATEGTAQNDKSELEKAHNNLLIAMNEANTKKDQNSSKHFVLITLTDYQYITSISPKDTGMSSKRIANGINAIAESVKAANALIEKPKDITKDQIRNHQNNLEKNLQIARQFKNEMETTTSVAVSCYKSIAKLISYIIPFALTTVGTLAFPIGMTVVGIASFEKVTNFMTDIRRKTNDILFFPIVSDASKASRHLLRQVSDVESRAERVIGHHPKK